MQLEAAIRDALRTGNALCKFISRNDAGVTGSHQCGFYLPKAVWEMFTTKGPVKGTNHKSDMQIEWPEGVVTNSVVTWYGQKTRSEYRLTRFGKGFPWLDESFVGSLLVLIPNISGRSKAYVLENEEDIETLRAALGIGTFGEWGVFSGGKARIETEDQCLERVFGRAIVGIDDFPPGEWMAEKAHESVAHCSEPAELLTADARLLRWIRAEYRLFRTLESKLSLPAIRTPFRNIDEFISVAATVMNRRKSRAGHSLEHHVEKLLRDARLPFDRQPRIDGKIRPDLLIPGKEAYENPSFPVSRLMVVGLKTTCKDRWRQVLSEGKRVPDKHLLTLQEAISSDQLVEMREAKVTLVVPKEFHKGYDLRTGINLLSVEGFLKKLRGITVTKAA